MVAVLAPLVRVIGYRAVLALSGYVVSNVAFLLAAVYFYRYIIEILRNWFYLGFEVNGLFIMILTGSQL